MANLIDSLTRFATMPKPPVRKWDEGKTREMFLKFWHTNDIMVRDQIFVEYLRLVWFEAGKFANRGVPFEDLFQVGCFALTKAINGYNPNKDAKFSTYATHTITGEIKRYFRDKGWIMKVSRKLQDLNLSLTWALDNVNYPDRDPTLSEIAEKLGVTKEEVTEVLELTRTQHILSFNQEFSSGDSDDDGQAIFIDCLGQEDPELESVENRMTLKKLFLCLNNRERLVLYLIFYENHTQKKTAKILGFSPVAISRIRTNALRKLRESISDIPIISAC